MRDMINYRVIRKPVVLVKYQTYELHTLVQLLIHALLNLFQTFCSTGSDCNNNDECVLGTASCPEHRVCKDTLGSYSCECSAGLEGLSCLASQDCSQCLDVDECVLNTDNCSENADCSNTFKNYSCQCKTYYSGDGFECTGEIFTIMIVTQNPCKTKPVLHHFSQQTPPD